MSGTAILVTDDASVADKVSTVFEFIDFSVAVADREEDTDAIMQQDKELVVALISLQDETAASTVIAGINKARPSLPVFLLNENTGETASPPKGVSGYLQYPVQYRTLLGILRNEIGRAHV